MDSLSILSSKAYLFDKSNKCYLEKNTFKVGSPPKGASSNLSLIAEKLNGILAFFKQNNIYISPQLSQNLHNLNVKIISRNEKIEANRFYRFLDIFLYTLSFGHMGLKIKPLDFNELNIQILLMPTAEALPSSQPPAIAPNPPSITSQPPAIMPPQPALPQKTTQIERLTITCPKDRNFCQEVEERMKIPGFSKEIKDLFKDGVFGSFFNEHMFSLMFMPDDVNKVSRCTRSQLAAQSVLIAPEQPKNRPFEYVSLGTGLLRQDLHQILGLLVSEDKNVPSKVNDITISLIDTGYADNAIFSSDNKNWENCLVTFAAILRQQAPSAHITLKIFFSVDDFINQLSKPSIDLLTGIRIENEKKNPEVRKAIDALSNLLTEDSASLISDTTKENNAVCFCKRKGSKVEYSLIEAEAKNQNRNNLLKFAERKGQMKFLLNNKFNGY